MIDRNIAVLARELVGKQVETTTAHEQESKYRSLCEGLPILLRTAGLTRTVTFLDAKKKSAEYAAVLRHLQEQLESAGVYSDARERTLELSRFVVSKELTTEAYCHVSRLAFRVAYWHKRLSQALLRRKDEES